MDRYIFLKTRLFSRFLRWIGRHRCVNWWMNCSQLRTLFIMRKEGVCLAFYFDSILSILFYSNCLLIILGTSGLCYLFAMLQSSNVQRTTNWIYLSCAHFTLEIWKCVWSIAKRKNRFFVYDDLYKWKGAIRRLILDWIFTKL